MSIEEYVAARKEGLRELHAMQLRGEDPGLPVLSERVPTLNHLSQVPLGLVQISLDQIAGTATKGRTTAFSRSFLPLLDPNSEFASKWSLLYDDVVEEGLRQPVTALEYYNQFYIVEGNKRVSVMRRLDAVFIEANVTRVLPEPEDSERYRVYREFLQFYDELFGATAQVLRGETLLNLVYSVVTGAMYDEFQQRVYLEPELSEERLLEIFREVYESYGFEIYDGYEYEWADVIHNFQQPLYYISYAVSAIPALELYVQSVESPNEAMDTYLRVAGMSD